MGRSEREVAAATYQNAERLFSAFAQRPPGMPGVGSGGTCP